MKILFYTGSLNSGGAERQLVYTANKFTEDGHEVKILINYPIYHYRKMLNKNIELICSNSKGEQFFKRYYYIIKIILNFKPDVVHSFLGSRNLEAMFFSYILRVKKRIASVRNVSEKEFSKYKLFNLFSTDIICNSKKAKTELELLYGENNKLQVVYNGIDLKKYNISKNLVLMEKLSISKYSRIGVFIGRITEQKNHIACINAYVLLYKEGLLNESDKLFLVGNTLETEIYNKIVKQVKNNNLQNNIIFLGEREDIPELLSIADYLILPSKYEGFPNVVMEAMASKAFVIATDVGGTNELVDNMKTGILIKSPSENDIFEALRCYLKLSMKNKNDMIEASYSAINKFGLKKLKEKTEKVYRSE